MKAMKRVAVITGSSRGLGAATAKLLAQNGYNVVINYSRSDEEAADVETVCRRMGADTLLCKADVARDEDCRRMAREAMDKWGRIDALVNNAATTKFCAHDQLDGLTAEDFQSIYATNVIGAYQMIRATAPFMQAAGFGAIVNVASTAGIDGIGSSVAYAASKGALITLTKSLARALGPDIRINAVCPGFIQGEWLRNGMGGEAYELLKKHLESTNPLRKTATPETIAPTIRYFLEEATLVTGQILILDGGRHLGPKAILQASARP